MPVNRRNLISEAVGEGVHYDEAGRMTFKPSTEDKVEEKTTPTEEAKPAKTEVKRTPKARPSVDEDRYKNVQRFATRVSQENKELRERLDRLEAGQKKAERKEVPKFTLEMLENGDFEDYLRTVIQDQLFSFREEFMPGVVEQIDSRFKDVNDDIDYIRGVRELQQTTQKFPDFPHWIKEMQSILAAMPEETARTMTYAGLYDLARQQNPEKAEKLDAALYGEDETAEDLIEEKKDAPKESSAVNAEEGAEALRARAQRLATETSDTSGEIAESKPTTARQAILAAANDMGLDWAQ